MQVKHDLTRLDKFVKSLSGKYSVRVGIFSDKTDRTDTNEIDNAAIGLMHELGSFERHIPIRSWLVMPLRVSSTQIIRDGSRGMVDLMAQGYMERVMKEFGFACEDAILSAFKSGGFGTWKPIAKETAERKGSTAILIETGQLRRAVASQVVTKP